MNDVYQSATWKLTAWYLALVMAISLIFSGVVYHFATNTLSQTLNSQQARIYKAFPVFTGNPFFVHDYDEVNAAHIILRNLVYFNIMVLVTAGIASYFLARRTLQPIQASNERQKRFVADASHELRTPLTALRMSTEVALLDPHTPKDELRAALQSNLEDTDKLTTLLNNLLRLSQLGTGELRHSFAPLTASDIVTNAVASVQTRADAKHITIHSDTSDSTMTGEIESLTQLVVILLDNAIKYSPDDTDIVVTAQQKDKQIVITVADHGIGIEPRALEHVFDRFYRADKSRTGNEGYGLGLSIAKQIADIHSGSITLTSRPGKGTTARVILPTEIVSQ